ncbi:hypothetical protein BGAL_0257g00060 [Botrytis galanthina]|uniref:Uncharacterized protein n=1 Tax=Botrytis galanthina TaxID=278940 RepID=A0A4S8R2I1_9HELO|nr:hypothetical protein BGAL_0257g00060 [Botrytis galanthina]
MTTPSPFWENIFLSVRAASGLFGASSTGLFIVVIVLYYLSKSNTDGIDLEPFKSPTFVAILLIAHFCGYLKVPDIRLTSESPEAFRQKTSGTNIVFCGAVLYLLHILRLNVVDLDPFHNPALFIGLAFAYTKGYLRFPERSSAGENPEVSEFRKALPAIEAVASRLAPYVKIGSLVVLLTYISINYGLALPLRPWLHVSLLAGIATIGFFAPTAKFYGPFRFGYLEYSEHISRLYKLLDWWCCVALFLFPYLTSFHPDVFYLMVLPIVSLSTVAILVAAWIYVFVEYRKQLLAITHAVAADLSRITIAASSTSEFASKVSEYDKQLFEAAKTARRDSLKATAIRITDFFVCGTTAWASFAEITEAARRITSKTNAIVEAATNVEDAEKPDHIPGDDDGADEEDESQTQILSRELREQAEATLAKVEDVLVRLEASQAKVRECDNARKQDIAARAIAEKYATAASDAVVRLDISLTDSLNESLAVVAAAERARILADQAITSATYGEMATARGTAASVRSEAATAEISLERGRKAMDIARAILLEWLQGK